MITDPQDVAAFGAVLRRDIDADYTPLTSPDDAVARADLIVVGRIIEVSEGITISMPEGLWDQMTTVEIEVSEVVSGEEIQGETVVMQISRSPLTPIEDVRGAVPEGRALFILDDITNWSPFPSASFEYPPGLAKGSPLYYPFTDGMWFDGGSASLSTVQEPAATHAHWAAESTFGQFVESLKVAAAASSD